MAGASEELVLPPADYLSGSRRARDPRRRIPPRRRDGSRLLFRAGLGSLGLALALGIALGRLSRGAANEAEVTIRGAGHLGSLSVGSFANPEAIRERVLAAGIADEVRVERELAGVLRVEVAEKRAVALLDRDPPQALAADGTVLGAATAADFDWAGAPDLVVVRGLPEGAESAAALSGRLAAALRSRPDLDRLVSELSVGGGPLRVELVLRSRAIRVLLTEDGFLDQLGIVAGLLPELRTRWPGLTRIDARVPDRLLVRTGPAPPDPEGGTTS